MHNRLDKLRSALAEAQLIKMLLVIDDDDDDDDYDDGDDYDF